MMRTLVTGANGFVGQCLRRKLEERGAAVTVLTRAQADLADVAAMRAALAGHVFDLVFHVAAHIPKTASEDAVCFASNAQGTFNLLEAIKHGGVRKLVYVSSTSVYGKPAVIPTPETLLPQPLEFYSLTKLMGEQLCESYARRFGFQLAILRPCGIHGPGRATGVLASWVKRALAGQALSIVAPQATKAIVHVEDLANACVRASETLTDDTALYNVAPAEEPRMLELAEAVRYHTHTSVPLEIGAGPTEREAYDISRMRDQLGVICRSAIQTIQELAQEALAQQRRH